MTTFTKPDSESIASSRPGLQAGTCFVFIAADRARIDGSVTLAEHSQISCRRAFGSAETRRVRVGGHEHGAGAARPSRRPQGCAKKGSDLLRTKPSPLAAE